MDTKYLEKIGESFITYALLKAGILVAKPLFDQLGSDLIGFTSVDDSARFCRIQCKYRGLKKATCVKINKEYVIGAFILFLYVKTQQKQHLFCFLPKDIRRTFTQGKQRTKNIFRLSITRKSIESLVKDKAIAFTRKKATAISNLIKSSPPNSELRRMVSDLARKMKEIERMRRKHNELQQLIHEVEIADMEKKACDEKLKILEEYMGFCEEYNENKNLNK